MWNGFGVVVEKDAAVVVELGGPSPKTLEPAVREAARAVSRGLGAPAAGTPRADGAAPGPS
jgi:hypothetical protein